MRNLLGAFALVAGAAIAQSPCFDSNYGVPVGNGDDATLPLQSIGFSFPFAGSTYTDFYPSTNGHLFLRNGAAATLPSMPWTASIANIMAETDPVIAPLYHDLNMVATNNANVFVNSSPSVCVVTWVNAVEFGLTTKFHLQAKLYPTGQIDFTYTAGLVLLNANTSPDAVVGCSPANAAPVPASVDYSAGGSSGGDSVFEVFNNTSLPLDLAGSVVNLISTGPGTPGSPFFFATSACPGAIGPAFNSSYGEGCTRSFNSFYENFGTSAAFDLNGTSMTLLYTGNGYVATSSSVAYVAPTGNATSLSLGDDAEVTMPLTVPLPIDGSSTSALTVCSNGFVSVGTGNGTGYAPVIGTFLTAPQTAFRCWHDYNPAATGSGPVKFEEAGGIVYVTWDGVLSFAQTTGADTFQFQFDTATGNVHYVWLTAGGVGNGKLIGYSPGGASQDPGSTDLSAVLPLSPMTVVNGPEQIPLGITATGTATPGGTVTLDATNVPPSSPFGAILFGVVKFNPGLPLTGIGMPGCFQYNEGAATSLFFAPNTGASFTAPTGTAFLGVQIQAQAAAYAPGTTPLGFIASGGIEMTLGT